MHLQLNFAFQAAALEGGRATTLFLLLQLQLEYVLHLKKQTSEPEAMLLDFRTVPLPFCPRPPVCLPTAAEVVQVLGQCSADAGICSRSLQVLIFAHPPAETVVVWILPRTRYSLANKSRLGQPDGPFLEASLPWIGTHSV